MLFDLQMNEPAKKSERTHLTAVPDDLRTEEEPADSCQFKGGCGGPPHKTAAGPGMLFYIGLVLVLISGFALSKDPATATYRQQLLSLGELRVSLELMFMAIGLSMLFTAVGLMQARHTAAKIERQSGNQIRSMSAKRLEKVSDDTLLSVFTNYFSTLFR